MKRISLTQGKEALVDDQDYAHLMQWRWHAVRSRKSFYAARKVRRLDGKQETIFMHREVAARCGQSWRQVDHRDRDSLNNQRSNLRAATTAENGANRGLRRNNRSGAVGVSWEPRRQKWWAVVSSHSGRVQRCFDVDDFDKAVAWRDAKAKELHGEFAYLNGAA